MNFLSGAFTYALVWWVVLFLVQPFGNRPSDNPLPGTASSAPANPRTKRMLVLTTVIALGVWFAIFLLIQSKYLSFRALVRDIPD